MDGCRAISANPLAFPTDDIREIEVLMAMVGGAVEYCTDESLCPGQPRSPGGVPRLSSLRDDPAATRPGPWRRRAVTVTALAGWALLHLSRREPLTGREIEERKTGMVNNDRNDRR